MEEIKLSGVVLTKNEEKSIDRCLRSLSFCNEIIVVDDFSEDGTVAKAKTYTDDVLQRKLGNDFKEQRNFAMAQAKGEWILFVDADEEVSPQLKVEIQKVINDTSSNRKGYFIPRRDFWWGVELKHGEVATARSKGFVRLVKKNSGQWMGKVHETFAIDSFVGQMKSFINHFPHPTVKDFLSEINHYTSIRAGELYVAKKKTNIFAIVLVPFAKFIQTYFFKLGFLDGPAGFAYSFFMSFHSFLVRVKLYQKIKYEMGELS